MLDQREVFNSQTYLITRDVSLEKYIIYRLNRYHFGNQEVRKIFFALSLKTIAIKFPIPDVANIGSKKTPKPEVKACHYRK